MFNEAFTRPWTEEEFPELAAWLETNEAALGLLAESIARQEYYSPFVEFDSESVIGVMLPHLGEQRRFARILAIRGFQAMVAGDDQAVIDHLNLLHRMGKLVSNEPTVIGVLVGISLHSMQTRIVESIAERGAIRHELVLAYLHEHAKVGGIDSAAESLFATERCMTLEMIQRTHAGLEVRWDFFLEEDLEQDPRRDGYNRRLSVLAEPTFFDVNQCLSRINEQYDAGLRAASLGDSLELKEELLQVDNAFSDHASVEMFGELLAIARQGFLPDGWTPQRYTEEVTAIYAQLLMPSYWAAIRTQQRQNTRRLVESTAIALLGCRDVHGELPESLEALVPVYFEGVPMDPYSDAPLIYRVNDDGSALVYSIGDNFEDNDGIDDYREGDIAIRIGAPPAASD